MADLLETLYPLLTLLGLASIVAVAAWLVADPRWRRQDDLALFALRGASQLLFVGGLSALFVWSFAAAGFLILGLVLIVAWLIAAQTRAGRRRAVVYFLAAAAERSMPLGPAVEALAEESPGRMGARLEGLAARLRQGTPLPEALARTPRIGTPLLPSAAAVGQQCGCLPHTLRQVAQDQSGMLRLMEQLVSRLWYLVFSLAIAINALLFFRHWILPRFKLLVDDFGVQLEPGGSSIWALLTSPSFLVALGYVALPLGLATVGLSLSLLWNPASPKPLGWLLWRLQLRGVLDLMALAVERRASLPSALCLVGDYLDAGRLRARLRRAAGAMIAGEPFEAALKRERLLTPAQAGVLHAAQRVGNLPWALHEVASTVGRRETRRVQAAINLMSALFMVVMACLVLMAALAVILPLVQLLGTLA